MTDPTYTHISYLVDRSRSMNKVRDEAIAGFNAFLKEQKEVAGYATITLAQFNVGYEYILRMQGINYAKPLSHETYKPDGGTALYDAVVRLITETGNDLRAMSDDHRPGKVVFVIQTDGEENSSTRNDLAIVQEMIEHQRSQYKWQFLFMGANLDALEVARGMAIPVASALTYKGTGIGTERAFLSASRAVSDFRTNVTLDAHFVDEDWTAQDGE